MYPSRMVWEYVRTSRRGLVLGKHPMVIRYLYLCRLDSFVRLINENMRSLTSWAINNHKGQLASIADTLLHDVWVVLSCKMNLLPLFLFHIPFHFDPYIFPCVFIFLQISCPCIFFHPCNYTMLFIFLYFFFLGINNHFGRPGLWKGSHCMDHLCNFYNLVLKHAQRLRFQNIFRSNFL